MTTRTVAALVLAALLAACSSSASPEPTPRPTSAPTTSSAETDPDAPLLAVVVAPQHDQAAVVERVRDLADRRDELRWSVATATSTAIVGELVGRAVDLGADLVCVVGVGRARIVHDVAAQVPGQRFCVGPSVPPDEPVPGVLHVDARVEETAYLAGAVAALVAGPRPAGIITDRSAHAAGRQQQAFELGLADVGGPAAVSATGPVADVEAAEAAAAAQLAGEVSVILADVSSANDEVVDVASAVAAERLAAPVPEPAPTATATDDATDAPARPAGGVPTGVVTGPEALDGEELVDDVVLAIVRLRPELVLLPAIDRLLGRWDDGPASVGLTEGAVAFDLTATPLADPLVEDVNVIRGEIAAGDRAVLPG